MERYTSECLYSYDADGCDAIASIRPSDQEDACEYRRLELVAEYRNLVAEMGCEAATNVGGYPQNNEKPSQTFDQGSDANQRRVSSHHAAVAGTNRQYIHDMETI